MCSIISLLSLHKIEAFAVTGVIISSVVPPLDSTLRRVSERYFKIKPLFVEPGIKTGMPLLIDNPAELGADRAANGVAAFERYGGPCVIVDFGTATTFDVISAKGEFLGGVIAPGLGISADALFSRAAKLARVNIKKPAKVIGTSTVTNLQSGIFYGYIGLVDGILARIVEELKPQSPGTPPKIVATGGLATLIADDSKYITRVDHLLTLDGLTNHLSAKYGNEEARTAHPSSGRSDHLAVQNYFNYFTEIEEHFQRRRGSLLMLSTLDWALIESWREAAVPLAAVLRGIDTAFDKYDARKAKTRVRRINGVAWCTQEVMQAVEDMQEASVGAASATKEAGSAPGLEAERIADHLQSCATIFAPHR